MSEATALPTEPPPLPLGQLFAFVFKLGSILLRSDLAMWKLGYLETFTVNLAGQLHFLSSFWQTTHY